MKHFILSLFSAFFLFSYVSVYAIEAPSNLRVTGSDASTITIDWGSVPGAIWYYHYLGTESWEYTDGIDLIDATEYRIDNLSTGRPYYITVTSVDEFWVESAYADEVVHSLWGATTIDSGAFRVVNMEVVDITTIIAEFSKEITQNTSSIREFILEQKSTGNEVSIGLSEIDSENPTQVTIILDTSLQESSEYEFTVLEVEDIDGNTIESGIDAFLSFTTESSFMWSPSFGQEEPTDLNSTWSTMEWEEEGETEQTEPIIPTQGITPDIAEWGETSSEENSGGSFSSAPTQVNQWNGWTTIASSQIEDSTMAAAENNETLPQTGPEHLLLALVAILLSAGVFYRIKR